ncbi:MAG: ATP-binding protein [Thermodesulfobacteriota bacterium]
MPLDKLFSLGTLIIILLGTCGLLPILFFVRLRLIEEAYRGLYRAWMLALFSLGFVVASIPVEILYQPYHHLLYLPAICLFIWSAVVLAKNTVSEYVLVKTSADLEEKVAEKTRNMEVAYHALQGLYAEPSTARILPHLLEHAMSITGARYGATGVVDKDGNLKEFSPRGFSEAVIENIGRMPRGKGLLGFVVEEKKVVRTDDIGSHPHSCGFPPNHPPMKTFLGVPLIGSDGDSLGFFYLTDKDGGTPFTGEDEELMKTLAAGAVGAMERLALYVDVERAKGEWEGTFDAMREIVIITDADSKILRANKAASRRLNVHIRDITGKSCSELFGGDWLRSLVTKTVETKEPRGLKVDIPVMGGSFWITTTPLRLDESGGVAALLFVMTDVTSLEEVTRLEEETKRLEEVNRFKSRLISIASHELRNPLTSIHGYVDLLVSRTVDEDTRKKWLSVIHTETTRLNRFIGEMLELSRIDANRVSLNKEPLDVDAIIREIVEPLIYRYEKHDIEVDSASPLPPVYADREKIFNIVANLMENAVKYSPDGGKVVVRVAQAGDELLISVTDEGVGVPAEDREKVFEAFYKVDSHRGLGFEEGSGIGLSVCKAFVELHGGRIWVESEEGKGSTFIFTLPLAGSAALKEDE